jgi:hypothetical protein
MAPQRAFKAFIPSQVLVYQDGHLQAGSVNALIQHIVPTHNYSPDVRIQSINQAVNQS